MANKVSFTFSYNSPVITDDQVLKLQEHLPNLTVDERGKPHSWTEHTLSLEKLYEIYPNAKVEITGVKGVDLAVTMLESVDRLEALATKLSNHGHLYNSRVEVHVPGLGLLAIDEVQVLTDCCTEKLQEYLESGWRIVAACPQPDQRRPDYVMGRSRK